MVVPASTTFAVITGGGTSGHVVPAIAIAELLVDAGHSLSSLHYVGSTRGAEVNMIPPLGLAHSFLAVDGLQRGVSLSKLKRNVLMVPTMLRALGNAKSLLKQLKPQVVISVGGYASIPTCRAARSLGIPVVTIVGRVWLPNCSRDMQRCLLWRMCQASCEMLLRPEHPCGATYVRPMCRRCEIVHASRWEFPQALGWWL
jgi:hypothetical protein